MVRLAIDNMGSPVVDIDDDHETFLTYFLAGYRYVGDMDGVISRLEDLVHNRPNAKLPDDWTYVWGVVIPRKDFVRLVGNEESDRIDFQRASEFEFALTWQGNILLDAESVDTNCKSAFNLKFSTIEFLEICKEWELVKIRHKQAGTSQ